MFYEESEITDLLKCENCSQPYDEYYLPRILPCCGKTICNTCLQLTDKQVNDNKYECIVCKKSETMPYNGFQFNQLAVSLKAKRPKELSRGLEADKLKKNICVLDDLVKKLIFETDNGECLITEHCNELRRQVQLAKEEKIEEINKHCDKLFLKIETYEKKCKCNYKEMNDSNDSKKKVNELIKSVNESIQQQNVYLRQLKIDEKKTMECNQIMNELKAKIENERRSFKKSMFANQIMKFIANTTPTEEEILGKIIYQKFDFTKILSVSFQSIELLDMYTGKCLKSFEGHSSWVRCAKLLNDNKIASCSDDKSIKIWDIETGDCIKTLLGHSGEVWSIAILYYNRIASCSSDESIRIWDVESGDCIQILDGHTEEVRCIVKYSNEFVLSGSWDETIKLWNVNSGECLTTFTGHLEEVSCVEILSHERIMSCSFDKTIKIWDVQTGDCLETLERHTDSVNCMKFLCDERIISGSCDGKIRIWCLATNSCIQKINAHSKGINEIQVLSENQVASCSDDNTIKIWDLTSASCIYIFQSEKYRGLIDFL